MKDDTISRAAVLDALADYIHNVDRVYSTGKLTHEDCMDAAHSVLDELPSAQPGWIPWDSGNLPKESGYYTVTAYDGTTKRVTHAKYQKRLKRWELTGARAYWRVLAWLPPIEPWEGEKDG